MLTVKDMMTRTVVAVDDTAPFKRMVELIEEFRVSALPVIEADRKVVGIVTEDDLIVKEGQRNGEEGRHPRAQRLGRGERRKADAVVAGEVMTAPVVTIRPEASLAEAARVMHRRHVKRLPVVDERGVLMGIISRSDLLRVFLRSDEEILREVEHGILEQTLMLDPGTVRVQVEDGLVSIAGQVERRSMIPIVLGMVRSVEGVVGVEARLTYAQDDTPAFRDVGLLDRSVWGVVSGPVHRP